MLQRWAMLCRAPRRPLMSIEAEVATLFDWLSVIPPSRYAHTVKQQTHPALPGVTDPDVPLAIAQLSQNPQLSASTRRVWAETMVLLTRSGSGSKAVAVLNLLPTDTQLSILEEAARRGLPQVICDEWRVQLGLNAGEAAHSGESTSPPPLASTVSRETDGTGVYSPARDRARTSPPLSVKELSTSELVQRAFSLHRPHTAAPADASRPANRGAVLESLVMQQADIFRELALRGQYKEAVQCIVHWQRKRLLTEHPAAADPVTAPPRATSAGTGSAEVLFDGFHALKTSLFPSGTPSTRTGAMGSRAARYHVLTTQPLLYARCVRDTAVAERLLRLDGPEHVREAIVQLLTAITATTATSLDARGATLPVLGVATCACEADSSAPDAAQAAERESTTTTAAAAADGLWRAVAVLSRLLHPSLRRETNAHKQAFIHALADAMRKTAAWHQRQVPLTAKTLAAARATVESACSALLQNEAQVRFIGLPVFATFTEALESMCPAQGAPNALVQCLLLCLGGPAACRVVSNGKSSEERTLSSAEAAQHSPALRFLDAEPLSRWAPALAMLKTAQERASFVVTSAHLRCTLSGLQSISIVKTWQQALACADYCVHTLGLSPDESSLEKILLNLKQASWQAAFRVLDYAASPPTSLKTASPSARVLRDLQLVAVKHASWQVTLELMDKLVALEAATAAQDPVRRGESRARGKVVASPVIVGFMNRVYCLYAAAAGGQTDAALGYLHSLSEAPQYRSGYVGSHHAVSRRDESTSTPSARPGTRSSSSSSPAAPLRENLYESPFNAVTVAIGAVAFLDHGHYSACSKYAEQTLSQFAEHGSARAPAESFVLSEGGKEMAAAARLLGLLLSKDEVALVLWLNALAAGGTTTPKHHKQALPDPAASTVTLPSLAVTLERAMLLQAMCGLSHLNAPVRLVFDTLAADHDAVFNDADAFETRQRATNARRRALYIPPRHYRAQVKPLITALGELVVAPSLAAPASPPQEVTLSNDAAQKIAKTVTTAGFGPEFLSVTLFHRGLDD